MADYINRTELIENLKKFAPEYYNALINQLITKQPTADVVEVKHGYWKDRYGNKYDNHLYECSVCGEEPLYEFYSNELQQTKTRQVLSNSCPHCGAKMDERKEGVE